MSYLESYACHAGSAASFHQVDERRLVFPDLGCYTNQCHRPLDSFVTGYWRQRG
ncbi:Uncharacterised protein [Vibrio cholerae]|nr:Uncharacterised protein [Vibrio cholerae]